MEEKKLSEISGLKALGQDRFAKLAPMNEALHFLTNMVLSDLPPTAKILCVGAGTGPELLSMAKVYPQWTFTVVEPLESLLNICQKRAEEADISSRCTFHLGYLDSLSEEIIFDGATALLVSQFLIDIEKRTDFFRQIFNRLKPNGYLVNADLSYRNQNEHYDNLFKTWKQTFKYAGFSDEEISEILSTWGTNVSVLPNNEIEDILISSGFSSPTVFYQALFIHGWYSKKSK